VKRFATGSSNHLWFLRGSRTAVGNGLRQPCVEWHLTGASAALSGDVAWHKETNLQCDATSAAAITDKRPGRLAEVVSFGRDQVGHLGRTVRLEAIHQLLQFTVGVGDPFMLTQMFDP
jgi:hypothetical protein